MFGLVKQPYLLSYVPLLGNYIWIMTIMPKYITVTKIQRKTNLIWSTRFPPPPPAPLLPPY